MRFDGLWEPPLLQPSRREVVRWSQSKYDEGGGYSGPGTSKVRPGHENMAEDEGFYEWKVPAAWLDVPVDRLVAAAREAWTEFFALAEAGLEQPAAAARL